MGPSGSGKSTLLHILGALDTPTEGTVAIAGERYDGLDDDALTRLRRDRIGFVFQFFNLLPSLTAAENVLPARADRAPPRRRRLRARAPTSCSSASASPTAPSTRPAELSGGQQQRVSHRPRAAAASPSSCSPTSRPATSTRSPAARSCAILRAA